MYSNYSFEYVVNNAEKIINDNANKDFSFKTKIFFKTKDGISITIEYDLGLNYACLKFSKNKLRLKMIEFIYKYNYDSKKSRFIKKSEIIELNDGFEKKVKVKNGYIDKMYYKEENSNILFFRPDGPAICCFSENGFVVSASYFLFGKLVRKKEYDDFVEKVKNGHFIKNINRIKDKNKIEHIYYTANFYGIEELVEKSKNKLMTMNILAKLEGGE